MKVIQLVHAHQARGHNICELDPLGMYDADLDGSMPPDLDIAAYGFTEADMDKEFFLGNVLQSGFLASDRGAVKLRDIIRRLQETYCGNIGVEYMHIWDHAQVNWIREQIETPQAVEFTREERLRMLERLCWSDHFEAFLANKYSTAKRFGLEGCEVRAPAARQRTPAARRPAAPPRPARAPRRMAAPRQVLIVGMEELIDTTADLGAEYYVMGMPHRGRLNVLANVAHKPMESIFAEWAAAPAGARGGGQGGGEVGGPAQHARRCTRPRGHVAGSRAPSRPTRRTTSPARATSSTTWACLTPK